MMMTMNSFLSIAGWLFFTVWSMIVGAVSLAAFGRDLFRPSAALNAPADPLPSTQHPANPR